MEERFAFTVGLCKIVGWWLGGGEGGLFACICIRGAWNVYYFEITAVMNRLRQKDALTLTELAALLHYFFLVGNFKLKFLVKVTDSFVLAL